MEATTTDAGGLNERRRGQLRATLVASLASWLEPKSPHSEQVLQFRVQSMIMLIARYAILDDDNVCDMAGRVDPVEAEQVIPDQLVSAATDLLCPR